MPSRSVMCDSLQPHGLGPSRLFCAWNFPVQSIGMGCHFLLQGIFLTQSSNPCLLHLLHCKRILYHWVLGKPLSLDTAVEIFYSIIPKARLYISSIKTCPNNPCLSSLHLSVAFSHCHPCFLTVSGYIQVLKEWEEISLTQILAGCWTEFLTMH